LTIDNLAGVVGTMSNHSFGIRQNNADRMVFYTNGDIRLWLGGSMKLLTVDGSGFVKAT
jgi:hypothetical protein